MYHACIELSWLWSFMIFCHACMFVAQILCSNMSTNLPMYRITGECRAIYRHWPRYDARWIQRLDWTSQSWQTQSTIASSFQQSWQNNYANNISSHFFFSWFATVFVITHLAFIFLHARMSGSGHPGHYNAAVHRAFECFFLPTTHALYYCMCMHEYRWPLDYAHAQLQYVDNIKWRYTKPKIYLLFSEVIAEVGSPSTGQNPPSRSLMVLGTVFNHFVWFTFLQNRCKFQ